MIKLEIVPHDLKFDYRPGETVAGVVSWELDGVPSSAELRLFWYTEGKGTQDLLVVASQSFANPARQDRREFGLRVPPEGPLSFSGSFISLTWALELLLEPDSMAQRLELLISNDGREIRLRRLPDDKPEHHQKARATP